ncbi:UNVERIFIED_CONTAM: hypothetical protein FKN15_051217 [Acipenser sinensis]
MDRNALAELLQALESRRDAEERRREERYTALIERVGLAVAAATTPTTTPACSFSTLAPQWWNDLPTDVRTAQSLTTFQRLLKTHLFRQHL